MTIGGRSRGRKKDHNEVKWDMEVDEVDEEDAMHRASWRMNI